MIRVKNINLVGDGGVYCKEDEVSTSKEEASVSIIAWSSVIVGYDGKGGEAGKSIVMCLLYWNFSWRLVDSLLNNSLLYNTIQQ